MASAVQEVQALKVFCNGERNPAACVEVTISADDPIFKGQGDLSHLTSLMEIPILIKRQPTSSVGRATGFLDNQVITYLMINPGHGLAPMEWQNRVGTVVIAIEDKKPLLVQHFADLWDYVSNSIISSYPENAAFARRKMCRKKFEQYCAMNSPNTPNPYTM